MITPSFSPTATERVLPKLALDFTTAVLDNRVTFTRTTDATHPATYVNSNGYVTAATNNQARFDYNPTTLVCKGLLIEESRSNLLTYSSDFSNAAWVYTRSSYSAANAVAPDGTASAYKLVEDSTAGNSHLVTHSNFSVTAQVYTASIFVKAAGRTQCGIQLSNYFQSGTYAFFDLTNITVLSTGGAAGISATISDAGNGWRKCTLTSGVAIAGAGGQFLVFPIVNGSFSYNGDGTSGIYVWGAQVEAGAFATSYIPTTSAALTRNADVATMTGTNFSDWYNASAGTFEATVIKQANGGLPYFFNVTDGTASNNISCFSYTNNDAECQVFTGGVSQANPYTAGSQLLAGNVRTLGLSYKNSAFYGAFNGAAMPNGNPVLSGTVPTVTYLQFGMYSAATNRQGFWIQKLRYWPQSLTNAETVAFSK